ncbi:MAG: hypothetical protein B6I28_02290 [Fusobacteriia bacterium 4572_132]|nr:MAG: hypothetical protein B6I28_02290 [Fusobacteriia bacterium 4572_132]
MQIKLQELKMAEENTIYITDKIQVPDGEKVINVFPDLTIRLIGEEVVVYGKINFTRILTCGKCLEEFESEFEMEINTIYLPLESFEREMGYEEHKNAYNPNNPTNQLLEDEKVNITELIRENVIVGTTDYPRCSEDCVGVDGIAEYENDGMDPRWQKLLDITSKKQEVE